MASSLIEQTRLVHQDLEKHMQLLVDDLLEENKLQKDRILNETRVSIRLQKMTKQGRALLELYDDEGAARKQELEELAGEQVFETFYEKLKAIRDYYRKLPDATVQEPNFDVKPKVKFSGAEVSGAFVDLNPFFERYINMPMFAKVNDYLTYLDKFDKFECIKQQSKFYPSNYPKYKQYLTDLCDYLASFQKRTSPLASIDELMHMVDDDFEKLWKEEKVPGWTPADSEEEKKGPSEEEKAKYAHDPLYCKACGKLFTKSSTYTNHLAGRKHKRAVQSEGQEKKMDPRAEGLAKIEFRVVALADLLRESIDATRDHALKKQTRTYDEIAADLEEAEQEEEVTSDEESEEEGVVYNPLNLPLGWDGKPIPYWLYKLHGLNIPYPCEICGGYTYRGPRAYERHFSEWRHTYGLRCLGINNDKAYLHVTKFEDALALHEKLQSREATSGWKPEDEEEYEDDEGNVFNKKTYEDLKRQGII